MINEISDAGSGRLYHYARRGAADLIVQDMYLLTARASTSEINLLPRGDADAKKWGDRFISFARSISTSSFTRNRTRYNSRVVVFEFNRNKLMANHKFFSVNYIGDGGRVTGNDEAEDRLVTFKEFVPIKNSLIGIHIYTSQSSKEQELYSISSQIHHLKSRIKQLEDSIKDLSSRKSPSDKVKAMLSDNNSLLNIVKEKLDAAVKEKEEIRNRDDIGKLVADASKNFPNVPIWVYTNPKAFTSMRWAEADQVNPNLPNPSEEDEDEED
jgi:hypothetical protein